MYVCLLLYSLQILGLEGCKCPLLVDYIVTLITILTILITLYYYM